MTFLSFNKLEQAEAKKLFFTCCGSENWVNTVLQKFPFKNEVNLIKEAEIAWYDQCNSQDWLEAFSQHPKIGDTKMLQNKFPPADDMAGSEQSGVNEASQQLLGELVHANEEYEKTFGFIFMVCATGKSAAEMLRLLLDRITNTREEELHIAMAEQHKITALRLKKLIGDGNWEALSISQLTTHVLDTSVGKAAENVTIRLKKIINTNWQTIAQGVTNADGRIADLLPPVRKLSLGVYKIVFETENYFFRNNIKSFFPEVEIQFTVSDETHYHVPLLINPFGYSTYRGS